MSISDFWSSPVAASVKHPEPLRQLFDALSGDAQALYNLTFYGSFAHKMLGIMRREGKDTQGFARMQQSFSEAVQKVREIVSGAKGFSRAESYTEMTQQGMTRLLELIDDLALVKDWQVHTSGDEPSHR